MRRARRIRQGRRGPTTPGRFALANAALFGLVAYLITRPPGDEGITAQPETWLPVGLAVLLGAAVGWAFARRRGGSEE